MHVFTFPRQTQHETTEISRAAAVFQTTLQVLKTKAKHIYKRDVMTPGRFSFFIIWSRGSHTERNLNLMSNFKGSLMS